MGEAHEKISYSQPIQSSSSSIRRSGGAVVNSPAIFFSTPSTQARADMKNSSPYHIAKSRRNFFGDGMNVLMHHCLTLCGHFCGIGA